MASRSGAESYHLSTPSTYSAAARKALGLTATVITLLPLPITYFGILPTYKAHASFLLFYVPFLCLLTLCYLFYVRDSLARVMFADVLNPPPLPDPYFPERLGERLGRAFRRLKGIILGILPVLLVIASMYFVSRYLVSFDQSVTRSVKAYIERADTAEQAALTDEKQQGRKPRRTRDIRLPAVGDTAAVDTLPPLLSDSAAVRQYVLRASSLQSIPEVVKLTSLYIGVFVALLVAVTLMALKEYAKEAMGLSEHELMFGRYAPVDPEGRL
jgi:hypothetical protein